MDFFSFLYQNAVDNFDYRMLIMWAIGGLLIFLAIKKNMEPTLLLPIGFGVILVNLPLSGVVDRVVNGLPQEGALSILYKSGIANELFPLILFIGIGAMIDFGPILANPKLMIFGAAAQFGIFFTLCTSSMFFDIKDAASIATIGRRPDRNSGCSNAGFEISRRNNGCGIFIYGTCTYHSAAGNKAAYNGKRAKNTNEI